MVLETLDSILPEVYTFWILGGGAKAEAEAARARCGGSRGGAVAARAAAPRRRARPI